MRKFIITLLLVIGIGACVFLYLRANPTVVPSGNPLGQVITTETPEPIARTPRDYHILEADGGIPLAEAQRAGLVGDDYAYLQGLGPITLSKGVEPGSGFTIRSMTFDLCYIFNSTFPEEQYAEFNLKGEWDELHFGVGYDDGHPSDPKGEFAIEVEVQGDGKVVFGPQVLRPTGEPVFTSAAVKGVHRITFVSRRIGYRNPFTPLIIDPFVRKYPAEPEGVE